MKNQQRVSNELLPNYLAGSVEDDQCTMKTLLARDLHDERAKTKQMREALRARQAYLKVEACGIVDVDCVEYEVLEEWAQYLSDSCLHQHRFHCILDPAEMRALVDRVLATKPPSKEKNNE